MKKYPAHHFFHCNSDQRSSGTTQQIRNKHLGYFSRRLYQQKSQYKVEHNYSPLHKEERTTITVII